MSPVTTTGLCCLTIETGVNQWLGLSIDYVL